MRVVHVTNTLRDDATGITNVIVDLAAVQAQQGHRVVVLCKSTDERMRGVLAQSGARVLDGFDVATPRAALRSARRARRLLAGADVVHVHTVRATALAVLGAPIAFLRHSVSTLHNPYQRSVVLMYLARRVVSISAADAEYVVRRSRGLRRPAVILNGLLGSPRLVAPETIAAAPLSGRPIVFVGALYERKGVDLLLRAMPAVLAQVPEARLHLVGNRDNPAIERLASELGLLDSVEFEGFMSDPRSFMKAAAVFVLPSRAEGFGNVLTEARSVGAPIIASDVGGIPEALDRGEAGLLVPPADVEALAEALVRVLVDDVLAGRLRAAAVSGLETARVERAVSQYDAVYESLVGPEPLT